MPAWGCGEEGGNGWGCGVGCGAVVLSWACAMSCGLMRKGTLAAGAERASLFSLEGQGTEHAS